MANGRWSCWRPRRRSPGASLERAPLPQEARGTVPAGNGVAGGWTGTGAEEAEAGVGGAGGPTRHGGQQRQMVAWSALRVAGGGGWRARPSSAPPRPRLKVSALCSRRPREHAKPCRRFSEAGKASPARWAWLRLVLSRAGEGRGLRGRRLALPGFARSPHSAPVRPHSRSVQWRRSQLGDIHIEPSDPWARYGLRVSSSTSLPWGILGAR